MKHKYIISILLLMMSSVAYSQSYQQYIEEVEKNNKRLEAARKLEETRKVQARTEIYPGPFSVNYGYFPDNNTVVDQKQTLNATQSFRLPGVYTKKKGLASERGHLASLLYQKERKNILFQAQSVMIQLVYMQRINRQLEERLDNARLQLNGMKKKKEAGDADIMEFNKAKFHLLRIKRQMSRNRIEIKKLENQLKLLNGGEEMKFELTAYPVFPEMPFDSLFSEKKEAVPALKIASQNKAIAESSVKLERSLNGPEFNLGYGSETVGNSSFKGVLFGASIPLWTNKNKVKAAQAEVGYMEMEYESKLLELKNETQKQFDTYLSLKESLEEYKATIEELESIQLLRKSLKLDQISALDFYREVEYYYTIYDEYLKLERDYYLALCELYRYRL